jgi:TolA protein
MARSKAKKVEVTAARLIKASKGIIMPRANSTQEHLFSIFVVTSIFAHIIFFWIGNFDWLNDRTPVLEEFSIDAEFIGDIDLGEPPPVTAIPDSKKADEARAPEKMLPQLPKKFTVKEQSVPDEGIAEKVILAKKAKKKALDKLKKKKLLAIKHQKDEANKLKAEDIRRRAALEMIRKNLKKSSQAKADLDDPLARLRQELKRRNSTKTAGGFASASAKKRTKKYLGKIYRVIRRNYELPQASNFNNAKLQVIIRISVGDRGNLMKMAIEKPSGDSVFDEMAIKAVRSSIPLPAPPKDLVAKNILLNFTPQSF